MKVEPRTGELQMPPLDEVFWREGEDEQVDAIITSIKAKLESTANCSALVQAQYIYDALYELANPNNIDLTDVAKAIARTQEFAPGLDFDTCLDEDREHLRDIALAAVNAALGQKPQRAKKD